jgi:hypothetical protein
MDPTPVTVVRVDMTFGAVLALVWKVALASAVIWIGVAALVALAYYVGYVLGR